MSEHDFSKTQSETEQARFLVRYALLAANSHNTQPWKFRVHNQKIEVIADLSRALPFSDPMNRELFISLGCALGNLLVAAEHFGFAPAVSQGALRPAHAALFPAIIEESTLATQGDEKIVAEWTHWMRSKYMFRRDGLPLSDDFGFPGPLTLVAPLLFRYADGQKQAEVMKKLFATAPVFFVIASASNTREQWMRAGIALTYLGLATTAIRASPADWSGTLVWCKHARAEKPRFELPGTSRSDGKRHSSSPACRHWH